MKQTIHTIIASLVCMLCFSALSTAQNNGQKEPDPAEMAATEADRLGELLKLEDWQIFYVDSTLQHDFAGMKKEMDDMMKSRVENMHLYQNIQDKWMDQIDKTYKKYFTEEQWKKYLKSGAGKMIKAREKRKAKLEKQKAQEKK